MTNMVSSLHIGRYNANANSLTTEDYHFDQSAGGPELYGICGLAVGDLVDEPGTDGVAAELVVTTFHGDLLVYGLELVPASSPPRVRLAGGSTSPLHHAVLDGALGVCNSIVIGDLDNDLSNELYVASTTGVRKFTWVTNP